MTVDCEDLLPREAEIRVRHEPNSRGGVVFQTGGKGLSWYGDSAAGSEIVDTIWAEGYETYEIRWVGEQGWATNSFGQGLKKTTCAFAEVVRWITAEIADNPNRVGVTGGSAGAWLIGYGLAVHGLEDVITVAVMTAGPMMADTVRACFDYSTLARGGILDFLMGWTGNGDYCTNGTGPDWVAQALEADSLVSSSSGEARDFDYPSTRAVFIQGALDEAATDLPLRFFDAVTSAKSWTVLPSVGHGVAGDLSGRAAITDTLLNGLKSAGSPLAGNAQIEYRSIGTLLVKTGES